MLLNNKIKRTLIAIVRVFHSRQIEWHGIQFLRFLDDLLERNINDLRVHIDKPLDQPGTSNAIYLRTLSGYPPHKTYPAIQLRARKIHDFLLLFKNSVVSVGAIIFTFCKKKNPKGQQAVYKNRLSTRQLLTGY